MKVSAGRSAVLCLLVMLHGLLCWQLAASGAVLFEETFEGPSPPQVFVQGSHLSDWDIVEVPVGPDGPHIAKFGINGGYPHNADTWLLLPSIDLPADTPSLLIFQQNYYIEADLNVPMAYDGLRVLLSADLGTTWYYLFPDGGYPFASIWVFESGGPPSSGYSGLSQGWDLAIFDLADLQGTSGVTIAFQFASDSDNQAAPPGFEGFWAVDAIRIGDLASLEPYIPEPTTILVLCLGLIPMLLHRRRKA